MKRSSDPSPNRHDPKTQTQQDYSFRSDLERYFEQSPGTATEKLETFSKYVPRQDLARFLARYELFTRVKNVQGSIVECGVQLGGGLFSFAKISSILEPYNFQRRIFGFDTFGGFPSIHAKDKLGLADRKSQHLKAGGFGTKGAYEDIQEAVELYDMNRFLNHIPKVHLIRGDFTKTIDPFLADYPHIIISLLYLDFDVFEPTKVAIDKLVSRIPKGGIIAFDELNEEAFPGETVAVLETMKLSELAVRRFDFEPRISYVVVGA
jgi:hypothetical protein